MKTYAALLLGLLYLAAVVDGGKYHVKDPKRIPTALYFYGTKGLR